MATRDTAPPSEAPEPTEPVVRLADVQALLADALAKQAAEFQVMLAETREQSVATEQPTLPAPTDADFARQLALAIAQISDQGTNRKRVAPEVLEQRERAWERMVALIKQARVDHLHEGADVPVYRLKHKVYFDEIMIDPLWAGSDKVARATEIGWPGVPNLAMSPVNPVAKAIYAEFTEAMGHVEAPIVTEQMRLTAGGVVIVTGRSPGVAQKQAGADAAFEGVQIRGRGVPGAIVEKRVLGTIAAPARQNA